MKAFGRILVVLILTSGLFILGFSWRDIQKGKAPNASLFADLVGYQPPKQKVAPIKVFRSGFTHIQQDFARQLDPSKTKYAGLAGMMASLGDPHTVFMEPKLAQEFKLETKAQFAGIGARLANDPLGAKVGAVFDESPAANAGVKTGDLITSVNGKSVSGQDTAKIADQIRGPVGTKVTLTITRVSVPTPIILTIQRAQITAPTVTSQVFEDGIGYINISIFSEPSAAQFEQALEKLDRVGLNGLVIDVRGNPGGLLESVRDILSLFLENKPAVTLKMRGGAEERTVTLVGKKREMTYPIVVLVNEDSASASEILAGVLKDYRIATLVGEHTYGKASVQNVISFRDGSSAKFTIARYYLPSGEDIARKLDDDGMYVSGGIKVHQEVKLQDSPAPVMGEPKTDNQLAKALEIVRQKSKRSARTQIKSDRSYKAEIIS